VAFDERRVFLGDSSATIVAPDGEGNYIGQDYMPLEYHDWPNRADEPSLDENDQGLDANVDTTALGIQPADDENSTLEGNMTASQAHDADDGIVSMDANATDLQTYPPHSESTAERIQRSMRDRDIVARLILQVLSGITVTTNEALEEGGNSARNPFPSMPPFLSLPPFPSLPSLPMQPSGSVHELQELPEHPERARTRPSVDDWLFPQSSAP
jgi:hypothetical protein